MDIIAREWTLATKLRTATLQDKAEPVYGDRVESWEGLREHVKTCGMGQVSAEVTTANNDVVYAKRLVGQRFQVFVKGNVPSWKATENGIVCYTYDCNPVTLTKDTYASHRVISSVNITHSP